MDGFNLRQNLYDWDKEDNILNFMQMYVDSSVKLLNDNAFEKEVLENIKNYRAFTPNNGHECLPPDYYSDSIGCMFDVLRINATEEVITKGKKAKTKNPAKIKERETIKSFEKIGFYDSPYCHLLVDVVGDPSFEKYRKQAQRVITDHISKTPIWVKEHPFIQTKGLVICDESPLCIEGTKKMGITSYNPSDFTIHETWNDIFFSLPIYKSDIDFVVWFNPCKRGSKFIFNHNRLHTPEIEYYPALVIVDTRESRSKFKSYDYDKLIFVEP